MNEAVKHPTHYTQGGIECIDAIKAAICNIKDPFEAYCTGAILKYAWRWDYKNGVEDLEKAKQYIDFITAYRADKPITDKQNIQPSELTEKVKEEIFAEPVKGKYEGMSNRQLADAICDSRDNLRCKLGICPLVVVRGEAEITCTPFATQYPKEFRTLAINWLKEHGGEGKG